MPHVDCIKSVHRIGHQAAIQLWANSGNGPSEFRVTVDHLYSDASCPPSPRWMQLQAFVCCAGEPMLCQECSERLWAAFLAPVVFYPLAAGEAVATSGPPEQNEPGVRRISANNWTRTWLPPGGNQASVTL